MALIVAAAVAGFVVARMLAERDVQRDSERRADVAAAQIHGRIAQAASLTESLRRFMLDASGTGVTSDQFASNAFRWLSPADFPAAAWVEPVPDSQRAAYERRIGQPIVTADERHTVVPAGSRSSYLAATLVSGFPPLALPGIDLSGGPDMAAALDRATHPDRVTATPVAGPDIGTNDLFLVAPAPNLVGESLRSGYVVVFVPNQTLSAAANTPGLQLVVGGTGTGGPPAGEQTVRTSFTEAGQRFDVILPRGSVQGAATALPWIILACGLGLAGLAAALGINAARRARAQNELDRIFNLSPDLIAVANLERRFTRVNPAAEQILGYTQDELLERPYLDFVHPDDRERTAAEAATIGQGKTTLSFENRYVRKDGSYRVLEWTATPVVEENVMYSVGRDVTERRRAEIELARLAGEQAALRRVATLVARGVEPSEVFAAVTDEVRRCLDMKTAGLWRFEANSEITLLAAAADPELRAKWPVGTRTPVEGDNIAFPVLSTGRPARMDDYEKADGPIAARVRQIGVRATIGVPILVDGRVWGLMAAGSVAAGRIPADAEARMSDFTDLVATAIAKAATRQELQTSSASLAVLAAQQAALRRVATLVARGVSPAELFNAVAEEMANYVHVDNAGVLRYEPDGSAIVLSARYEARLDRLSPVGDRLTLEGDNVPAMVLGTGRAARMDRMDNATGSWAARFRERGIRCVVAVPIVVEGTLWGIAAVGSSKPEPLPPDTEELLGDFADLVATALANAATRDELNKSRGRIVAAADETRRRLERNLHDGAQQRAVSLGLQLRLAQRLAPAENDKLTKLLSDIDSAVTGLCEELREISHGLHPAALAEAGLGPAVKQAARRSTLPVTVNIAAPAELPETVEVAAYYVVAESLTNAAKHAQASAVIVTIQADAEILNLSVQDNGIGGADFANGSGLIGLKDRVEALGGQLSVSSPAGNGTSLTAAIPLHQP